MRLIIVASQNSESRFTILGERRLGINKEDVKSVKESITSKDGLGAKWIPIEAEKLIKVETADGQVFFIEIQSSVRTPKQTANALLGEGKWAETKQAFYVAAEEAGMKIPEGLKGSKELNLILQKELLNGWRPGDKISVTAKESIKSSSIFRRKAIELIEKFKKIEPEITNNLSEISLENSGKLVGLEYRLKNVDSLERKLMTDGINEPVNDVLRYTMVFDLNFTKSVLNSLTNLTSRGYQVKNLNGEIFELQFHTSESFNLKQNINHSLYEEYRLLNPKSKEAIKLFNMMIENSKSIINPKDVEKIE